MRVLEYLDLSGRSPFGRWFDRLDAAAAAKITIAIARLGEDNLSNVKGVATVSSNIESISARATGFTSAAMATFW
jgi:hypothetical protein